MRRHCVALQPFYGWFLVAVNHDHLAQPQHLSSFTLSGVIEEIRRWSETGSCFARWVEKLGLTDQELRDDGRLSLLDRVIPVPDG
ncbi:MAG: hypothetical protein ABSG53_16295 [Thermoguttaceae bacterium]